MTHTAARPILKRYETARQLMRGSFSKAVAFNTTVFPVWIDHSDCCWYLREKKEGKEFRFVDAKAGTNTLAFDHHKLAAALAELLEREVNANNLPFEKITINLSPRTIGFKAFDQWWQYDATSETCVEVGKPLSKREILSPDGRLLVFEKDHNLWLRDVKNNEERPLTTDGEADYRYGAPGQAWGHGMGCGLQVRWSSDSQRIFTVQRDLRGVKALPVVHHVPQDGSLRPQIEFQKFAYPGDEHVESLRLLAIDVSTGRHQPAHYAQIPVTRNTNGLFTANLAWWGKDNHQAYFVHVDRYYKYARLIAFDTDTGLTRLVFEERATTHINMMLNSDELPTFIPLPESDEFLWFSERSGWAHLYLYDLKSGALKHPVSRGDWLVRQTVHFDSKRREVFVQTAGRSPSRDPYYRDLVRINIDTGELFELISGDYDVTAASVKDMTTGMAGWDSVSNAVSHAGNYAVVTRSRADEVPVTLLIDRQGQTIMELERADISGLPDGWNWPEPVKLMAADGKTDIYGLVYRPSDFSPENTYPIISHGFNTCELTWVSKGSFTNHSFLTLGYLDAAALAELGCIVVQIDGRGTPFREKTFHDESYGWAESASKLEDHVAGIQQLAERYPYMDLDRVGITTHVTGGPGAVQGLLHYPDFFKVAVASLFHDSRLVSSSMWGDKFEGPNGPNPEQQYPEELVDKLQGKLLLQQGMLDGSTPPAALFRLIEALQKANKDFDMIFLPNVAHEPSRYLVRRSWDYFVQHLFDETPPKEFSLSGVYDGV